jgi:hypothetical protein
MADTPSVELSVRREAATDAAADAQPFREDAEKPR